MNDPKRPRDIFFWGYLVYSSTRCIILVYSILYCFTITEKAKRVDTFSPLKENGVKLISAWFPNSLKVCVCPSTRQSRQVITRVTELWHFPLLVKLKIEILAWTPGSWGAGGPALCTHHCLGGWSAAWRGRVMDQCGMTSGGWMRGAGSWGVKWVVDKIIIGEWVV